MMRVKPPVVAGLFYPDNPAVLRAELDTFFATTNPETVERPRALIVPHAGYRYSGPVAAHAYAVLRPWASQFENVVVLAPSHRVAFRGIATSSAAVFQTPLGDIPVARDLVTKIEALPGVGQLDAAFAEEHALEVQLPFLQTVLTEFSLVPLIVGDADPQQVSRVVDALQADDTLIVVSSDLSHYEDYASCRAHDRQTSGSIEALRSDRIGPHDACGAFPLNGLLTVARQKGWRVETLDLRNSGDTGGDRSRVVGYGAYVLH